MFIESLWNLFCFDQSTDPAGGGGGSGGTTDDPNNKPDDKPETVSREAFERLMDETKATKAKLKAYEDEKKKKDEEDAKKRGDFETLLEQERQEKAELEKKLKDREEADQFREKAEVFLKSVGAAVDKKYWPIIETFLEKIPVGTDGKADSKAAAKLAEDFKKLYPEVVSKPGTPNVPGRKPSGTQPLSWGQGTISRHNLKEAKENLGEAVAEEMRRRGMVK